MGPKLPVAFVRQKWHPLLVQRAETRPRRRTARAIASVGAVVLSLSLAAGPVHASPNPPPNPSDAQLQRAARAKNDTATMVGALSARIAQAQSQLIQLNAAAELAGQKYALALSELQQAQADAEKAKKDVATAEAQVVSARKSLTTFVQQSYMSRTPDVGPAGLLTARDPSALLQANDYTRYVADRHLDAKTALDRATVAKSNADAQARAAVAKAAALTEQANQAKDAAIAAVAEERVQAASLQQQQAEWQAELEQKQEYLAMLNGQRDRYVAWKKEQERIAAIQAHLRAIAAARAAAAAAAAEAARAAANGGQQVTPSPNYHPTNGNCKQSTPQLRAVCFAEAWLGTPYAWAGGNADGPTYGVDSPGTDGWNDHTVYGFDCSGLTLYAWANAAGLYMSHYAASQYFQAGSFHPSPDQFQPGDLLFWSSGGAAEIHHVALYVGDGNVIQAPNSGSYVQITPWDQVSPDYFGATRPLS